jgi:hypothetical protein
MVAMSSNIPKDKSEFDKLVDYAKLQLNEKELDMKEDIVRLQMKK